MGLDTYIYKGWHDEYDVYYDINTKRCTPVPRLGIEFGRFRKNYVFMEWLEKRLDIKIEDQYYYVLYADDVKALLADCELVIDLVEDANKNELIYKFSDELLEQIVKIFPQDNWNKQDFSHWDEDADEPVLVPHVFNMRDYDDIKNIHNTFSEVINEYVDKVIINNSW